MEFLSLLFFCLSPFALFCSDNGTGLLLCPIFILVGFIFKWIGSLNISLPKREIDVEKEKRFWEIHYKDAIAPALKDIKPLLDKDSSLRDIAIACRDRKAREWATWVCRCNNAWIPPFYMQEQIARENGVITEQVVKERAIQRDRIQIGKYYLMRELENKHGRKIFKSETTKRQQYVGDIIKKSYQKLELSDGCPVTDGAIKIDYNTTASEMWLSLSEEEKKLSEINVKKFEEELLKKLDDYLNGGDDFYRINVEL